MSYNRTMSRSYKKAIHKDGYGTKRKAQAKKTANRSIRKMPNELFETNKVGLHKRLTCTWNICDYTIDNRHSGRGFWGVLTRHSPSKGKWYK